MSTTRRRLLAVTAMAGLLAMPMASVVPAASAVPPGTAPVLINEVATRDQNGVSDEFIELRNNTNQTQDLSNWTITVCDATGAPIQTITIGAGQSVTKKTQQGDTTTEYLLLTNAAAYSGAVPDPGQRQTYAAFGAESIPDMGGVELRNNVDQRVDAVGFSDNAAPCLESPPAVPQSSQTDPRNLASQRDRLSTDTDANLVDFRQLPRTPGRVNFL